ncbi:MAG: hypothetical protein N3A66_00845 [Planctomycetota bacterium]|nr:hypothetical protein [Planctomycetota bacterium]
MRHFLLGVILAGMAMTLAGCGESKPEGTTTRTETRTTERVVESGPVLKGDRPSR